MTMIIGGISGKMTSSCLISVNGNWIYSIYSVKANLFANLVVDSALYLAFVSPWVNIDLALASFPSRPCQNYNFLGVVDVQVRQVSDICMECIRLADRTLMRNDQMRC